MKQPDLEALLILAVAAARAAQQTLGRETPSGRVVQSEVGRDIKIGADRLAEQAILKVLAGGSSFDVLSEETGWVKNSGAGPGDPRWIVDPLDGTYNFTRGIPFYCCSIALWHGRQPLAGVVLDLPSGDLFTGVPGQGAWLNESPMRVSLIDRAERAVLSTGFPTAMDFSGESYRRFQELLTRYKKVRMLGAAALSLASVASGRAEVHFETNTRFWDVAAGIALVLAAGGQVDFQFTRDETTLDLYAWNGMEGVRLG